MALTRGGVSTDTNRATKPSKTPSKRPLPSTFSDEVIVVFVLGGPGSGKGSQCLKIMDRFGFKHLCAGELLQAEIDSGSENGAMIHNFKKAGKIVPSTVTVKLLQQAMSQSETRKFIIDGFPRNEENRIAFEQIVSWDFPAIIPIFIAGTS